MQEQKFIWAQAVMERNEFRKKDLQQELMWINLGLPLPKWVLNDNTHVLSNVVHNKINNEQQSSNNTNRTYTLKNNNDARLNARPSNENIPPAASPLQQSR